MRFDAPAPARDPLRGFDPRARIAACLALLAAVSRMPCLAAQAALAALCAAFLWRDLPRLPRRLLPLEPFCLLFLPQAALGFLDARAAALYILRIHAAALVLMLFITPLGVSGTARALSLLRVSPKLIALFYLSARSLDLAYGGVFTAIEAMRARRDPALRRTGALLRVYGAIFAAALAAAFSRSEALGAALAARGFSGVIPLTETPRWRARDTALACAACVLALLAAAGPAALAAAGGL